MSSLKGYLTAAEVAEMKDLDHSQICRYCQRGDLPAIKVGNQWFIRESDARNFDPPPRGNPNFRTASSTS